MLWEYKRIWKIGLLHFHKCRAAPSWVTLVNLSNYPQEIVRIAILRKHERSPYLSSHILPLPHRAYLQCKCGRMNVGPTQCHWRMLGGCLTLRQACTELGHPESLPAETTRKRPRDFRVWEEKKKDTTQNKTKFFNHDFLICGFKNY